jgi:tripartite-type tricarboxylate transporter receptor subunit TctC
LVLAAIPEDRVKLIRRKFLHLSASAAALPALSRFARAQTYPTRPVRMIVPFAPAGTTDIAARLIGQWLSEHLGQQFVVENRPGANGNIGTEAVVRAPPDGYMLLMVDASPAINASLYDKLNFNFIRDTAPVASVVRTPLIVAVHPSAPAKTIPEFIAYAKANPGKINYGSAGIGSTLHVTAELFKIMAGVDLVHVPYRGGGPAIADLIAGQVQAVFIPAPAGIEHVRGGALRALAVTAANRFEALPELPTVGEHVPGFEANTWYGVVAPKRTASAIIESLNKEINAGLLDPRLKARFAELGAEVLSGSPADFGVLIAAETEKWGKVIKEANIKLQ